MKYMFNQAVISQEAAVVNEIRKDEIKLSVWQNPLSTKSITFIDAIEDSVVDSLVKRETESYKNDPRFKSFRDEERYYSQLGYKEFDASDYEGDMRELLKPIAFGKDYDAFERDIFRLTEVFGAAIQKNELRAQLIVFKPRPRLAGQGASNGGYWHVDGGNYIGIITLKGDCGTLWRPSEDGKIDESDKDVDVSNLGDAQQIKPQDFGVFKARKQKNPLVHATPPYPLTQKNRLVLLLSNFN
jgi:hypothetical protein